MQDRTTTTELFSRRIKVWTAIVIPWEALRIVPDVALTQVVPLHTSDLSNQMTKQYINPFCLCCVILCWLADMLRSFAINTEGAIF
jgi:hypothetical protein